MVSGKYYDVSEFVALHPGGSLVLLQSMGTDVTASFKSHHLSNMAEYTLQKYEVKPPEDSALQIKDLGYSFSSTGFFETLKQRVAAEVPSAERMYAGPMYVAKLVVVILIFFSTWLLLLFPGAAPSLWTDANFTVSFLLLGVVNACVRCVITGYGHECVHGHCLNVLTSDLFDWMMLYPSSYWHSEHATRHHPHCKRGEEDLDPDETLPGLRMGEFTMWEAYHVPQVITQFLIGLLAPFANFVDHHLIRRRMPWRGVLYFVAFHFAPFLFLPMRHATMVWMIGAGLGSWITVSAFHVSHINEDCAKRQFTVGDDWGEHQLRTSANFIGRWQYFMQLTGMLEMQIEHHLFPCLSYPNQHRIRPIVKRTAEEFGLPYVEYQSLGIAFFHHMKFLTKMSFPSV